MIFKVILSGRHYGDLRQPLLSSRSVYHIVSSRNNLKIYNKWSVELTWCSGSVMDCHATAWGSIPGGKGVKTELHVLHKGQ